MSFFDFEFLGNTMLDYLIALGITFVSFFILIGIKKVVITRFRKFADSTKNKIDDFIADLLDAVYPFMYLIIALYVGSLFIVLQDQVRMYFNYFCVLIVLVYGMRLTNRIVNYSAESLLAKRNHLR